VGDRGRLVATGDPELGEDVGDMKKGGLLRDEQRLADLPVGPARSHQGEHFSLAAGLCKGCGQGGSRLGRRGRADLLLEAEAAALGEQLDLPSQRRRPKVHHGLLWLDQLLIHGFGES
jgi:hypothetical protein